MLLYSPPPPSAQLMTPRYLNWPTFTGSATYLPIGSATPSPSYLKWSPPNWFSYLPLSQ